MDEAVARDAELKVDNEDSSCTRGKLRVEAVAHRLRAKSCLYSG